MLSADDKIEFVAEKSVASGDRQMQDEGNGGPAERDTVFHTVCVRERARLGQSISREGAYGACERAVPASLVK